jgi:hypothetical protein
MIRCVVRVPFNGEKYRLWCGGENGTRILGRRRCKCGDNIKVEEIGNENRLVTYTSRQDR